MPSSRNSTNIQDNSQSNAQVAVRLARWVILAIRRTPRREPRQACKYGLKIGWVPGDAGQQLSTHKSIEGFRQIELTCQVGSSLRRRSTCTVRYATQQR